MASGAEEFKAFEAAGWSRRANTYGRVTGGHELLAVAKVGSGRRP